MVMPWLPCIPCANAIITSGIKKLIVHKQMIIRTKEEWKEELINAMK
jgi:deoxycytidylate deaminase